MNDKQKDIMSLVDENVAQEVVKRAGRNPEGKGLPTVVETEKGDNAKYLKHSLAMWDLPVIDIRDEKLVEERIKWYFGHCIEDDMKPTVSGLALSLGIDRKTLWRWATGQARDITHSPIVKKAYDILSNQWEEYMQNGKINPVSGIFLGKNHFGYVDKQEIVVEPRNPLGDDVDPREVQKKYLEEQKALEIAESSTIDNKD